MSTETALQTAAEILEPLGAVKSQPEPNRLDFLMPDGSALHEGARLLRSSRWGYLTAITGLDHPAPTPKAKPGEPAPPPAPAGGEVEVLYHFCQGAAIVTLRMKLPYGAAAVPSVCDIIPSASIYEREIAELFGVRVEGTPNMEHLLLPEDWPEGVYPLRKSFTGKDVKA